MGKAACCGRQCIKEQVRNKASQERSSTNGKVRPNGKQSRRSITHANSWSVRLMQRLNDFLVMPPFRLETRLRTVHDVERKTKKRPCRRAVVLHLIGASLHHFYINSLPKQALSYYPHYYFAIEFSSFFDTDNTIVLPVARLPSSIVFFHTYTHIHTAGFVILLVNTVNTDISYRK